jgi:hypothetical protein
MGGDAGIGVHSYPSVSEGYEGVTGVLETASMLKDDQQSATTMSL